MVGVPPPARFWPANILFYLYRLYHILSVVSHYRERHKVEVFVCLKIKPKNRLYHFYPFAKDRREKINELQAMIFDEESANEAQKILAPPKNLFIDFTPIFFKKNRQNILFGLQK